MKFDIWANLFVLLIAYKKALPNYHVSGANCLNFIDRMEALIAQELIEVRNYLVEKSQTLDTLIRPIQLGVELLKVG